MLLLGLLALILVFADFHFHKLETVRSAALAVATPFYWLAAVPGRVFDWGEHTLVSRSTLLEENAQLRSEALVLKGRLQKMAALVAENGRLRSLLNSVALLDSDDVMVAEIIGESPVVNRQELVIDKGSDVGVFVGQPVIDADGLMGQVIEVSPVSARVLLITDATHALPVQINRNGVRAIAEGTGRYDQLELRHVAPTTDIQVGDLLVSSGLGQRFPVGYPVAKVTAVIHDPGKSFLEVKAEPMARLTRSRHVLLVFNKPQIDQLKKHLPHAR